LLGGGAAGNVLDRAVIGPSAVARPHNARRTGMNEHHNPGRARGPGKGLWHVAIIALCLLSAAAILLPVSTGAEKSTATLALAVAADPPPWTQTAAQEPLAATVDWSGIEAAPEPSPMSVAAYEN
jgi:hypothetical protein